MGGYWIVAPHWQILSSKLATRHLLQAPLWHNSSHRWLPQAKSLLQICIQICSLSSQHTSVHWCFEQDFFFWQRRSHNFTMLSLSPHLTVSVSLPHRQWISTSRSHPGHSPTWHVAAHVWKSLVVLSFRLCGHLRSLPHDLSHVGTGSLQLVRIILFLRSSSRVSVFPHGQWVRFDGMRAHGLQAPKFYVCYD